MKAFQRRVVEEKRELDQRLLRLTKFLLSEKSWQLKFDERCRMIRQRDAMTDYSEALGARIAHFEI